MKKFMLMALTAVFALSVSAQCPEKKGDCCKKEKTECYKKDCKKNKKEGDLVITLGCGDVYKLAKRLASSKKKLKRAAAKANNNINMKALQRARSVLQSFFA